MATPPSPTQPAVRTVMEMWATYRDHGVEAALPLLHPEVSFVDRTGRAFAGHDGVRRFFAGFQDQGERFSAFPYSFEARGGEVLVAGYRRVRGGEREVGGALYFAHRVRDGLIVHASAHDTREEALAGIAERDAAAGGRA